MVCKQCSTEIPHGKRYKTEQYKTLPFCSKACYENYLESKKQSSVKLTEPMPDLAKLKDYIKDLYPYNLEWSGVIKQIKNMCKEYGISCMDILLTIRYAMEYEHHEFDNRYMLGQFIPKYLSAATEFANMIRQNRKLAKEWNPEDEVYIVKRNKTHAKNKNCEW